MSSDRSGGSWVISYDDAINKYDCLAGYLVVFCSAWIVTVPMYYGDYGSQFISPEILIWFLPVEIVIHKMKLLMLCAQLSINGYALGDCIAFVSNSIGSIKHGIQIYVKMFATRVVHYFQFIYLCWLWCENSIFKRNGDFESNELVAARNSIINSPGQLKMVIKLKCSYCLLKSCNNWILK